jgi:hypothetical protein
MSIDLEQGIEVLSRTPGVLRALLQGISDYWARSGEGDGTWSPYDVVGHLIHGERTDWIPRARIILSQGDRQPFEPFDRLAQFKDSAGKSLEELLGEFEELRHRNIDELRTMRIGPDGLERRGLHPELGPVTLGQLLAMWVVHDLAHIRQIARAMARRYQDEVGPWKAYTTVFDEG